MSNSTYYFYLDGETQRGPVTADQLLDLVTPETPVWREGLATWVLARELPELVALQQQRTAPADTTVQPTAEAERPLGTAVMPPDPRTGFAAPPKPNNYLVWLILLTIFCSGIFGLAGIVFSITCNQRYAKGDYKGAELASDVARNFVLISVVVAVLTILGLVIFFGAMDGAATLIDRLMDMESEI